MHIDDDDVIIIIWMAGVCVRVCECGGAVETVESAKNEVAAAVAFATCEMVSPTRSNEEWKFVTNA